jgi:Phosphotransferase enzyme family
MGKDPITLVQDGLGEHPALAAWRAVDPGARRPKVIEILKPEKRKCAVFRIHGVGANGRPVVAKRRPASDGGDGDVELRLYTELLPTLSIPCLELYGSVSDEDYSWLFLEDAGEVWYDPGLPEHRALAVEWFAALHAGTTTHLEWFPATGTAYFRDQVQLARDGVIASLVHPGLSASDVDVLRAVLVSLAVVEERWDDIEAICAGMPETLVHGDFVKKNVRVRETRAGAEMLAFDWETAGWATPAADLALLPGDGAESRAYHRRVVARWPGLSRADVDRLRRVGTVLRLVHSVYWEARSFRHAWIERAMRNMASYDLYLAEALRDDLWLSA